MRYKAAIFDLDDTFYDYERLNETATDAVRTFTCEKLGITAEHFDTLLLAARRSVKSRLGEVAACHNRVLYYQNILEQLRLPPAGLAMAMEDVYWGCLLAQMELFPGVAALLARLRADGAKIAVCTDMSARIQHEKLHRLGLRELVDVLVTSEEAGIEKPSPVIFALCLEKLGIAADDCFFVGDDMRKDVRGAQAAGIHPVWFGVRAVQAAADAPTSVPVVMDFAALERWIYG